MRHPFTKCILALAICWSGTAIAADSDETTVESRVESVGLFKNGLAYLTRTVKLPNNGRFTLSDVPSPSHGTFWIESPADVRIETRVIEREDIDDHNGLASKLVGGKIEAYFKNGVPGVVGGVITGTNLSEYRDSNDEAADHGSSPADPFGRTQFYYPAARPAPPSTATQQPMYILVEAENGVTAIDPTLVEYAMVTTADGVRGVLSGETLRSMLRPSPTKKRTVMSFDVRGADGETEIRINYLTSGIAWAPSYKVDISDKESLVVAQKSVIKNELETINDAEFYLISGFPAVEFGRVISPLALQTTWAQFFQQLSNAGNERPNSHVMTQQAVMSNYAAPGPSIDFSADAKNEGPDLHYHSIGVRSLALGESLTLDLGHESAEYERLVEWTVPDSRDANGRYSRSYNQEEGEQWNGVAWDALQFDNPFDRPMTTAPAMVVAGGRILGQKTSYFVNSGEQTHLKITKALSIRTQAIEREQPDTRDVVYIAGNDYYKASVEGRLVMNNHRNETVKLIVRRRFSGQLIEADGDPEERLLADGAWCVNQRNELIWTLTLEPSEDRELKYGYSVLVDR